MEGFSLEHTLSGLWRIEDTSVCSFFKKTPERFGLLGCLNILHLFGCDAFEDFPCDVCTLIEACGEISNSLMQSYQ